MAQFGFGSGVLVGTATTDAYGATLATPTPIQLGILQEGSVDFSFDIKELFGQYQFPVAVGRGKGKIQGKAKTAQLNGLTINSLFFGQTLAPGSIDQMIDYAGTIPASSPYTVTPTIPSNGTSFAKDLGVIDANGAPMMRVATVTASGQYSLAASAYTFHSSEPKSVRISFQYNRAAMKKVSVANVLMGAAPQFGVDLMVGHGGKNFILSLPCAVGSKMTFATKQDDFMVPEFDFSAFADPSGNVAYISTVD